MTPSVGPIRNIRLSSYVIRYLITPDRESSLLARQEIFPSSALWLAQSGQQKANKTKKTNSIKRKCFWRGTGVCACEVCLAKD